MTDFQNRFAICDTLINIKFVSQKKVWCVMREIRSSFVQKNALEVRKLKIIADCKHPKTLRKSKSQKSYSSTLMNSH